MQVNKPLKTKNPNCVNSRGLNFRNNPTTKKEMNL